MRKIVIAGNWKMNKTYDEATIFFRQMSDFSEANDFGEVDVIVCPPFLYLANAKDYLFESPAMVGAQNICKFENGAYTGEISAEMLHSMDITYCIIGHSERRKYYNETDIDVREKLELLVENEITPIVCIGETEKEREKGITKEVITQQLLKTFEDLNIEEEGFPPFYVAYEPIWAIGTGLTATPEDAEEIHKHIREWLREKYSDMFADALHILYGGSVKPDNVRPLLNEEDIDGALVGGASLKFDSFTDILNGAKLVN